MLLLAVICCCRRYISPSQRASLLRWGPRRPRRREIVDLGRQVAIFIVVLVGAGRHGAHTGAAPMAPSKSATRVVVIRTW